jgi:hypothetical protein
MLLVVSAALFLTWVNVCIFSMLNIPILNSQLFSTAQQQSSLFGQQVNPMQQQQQQLQPQEDPVVTAVMNVNCTGDERDAILSRWNLIQAQWGTGKGF